jgi:hypothetical protein
VCFDVRRPKSEQNMAQRAGIDMAITRRSHGNSITRYRRMRRPATRVQPFTGARFVDGGGGLCP